jgi:hypothetical protein
MQKVVGSNPISRFASNPLHLGHSALAGEDQNHPAYRLHFGHQFPNDGDAWRLAAISADFASLSGGGGVRFASAKA